MPHYREIELHVGSLHEALSARDRLAALDGVEVFHVHTRALGFLERARLFLEEHVVRILIEVDARRERIADARELADPYRTFDEVIRRVSPRIGAELDALGATHREIGSAFLYFNTRAYEAALIRGFEADVRALVGDRLRVEAEVRSARTVGGVAGILTMRLRGSIPVIHEVAAWVRRSGLVEVDALRLGYH
ncbi:MAG: hypothetical protein R3B09_24625 [Nannocystaceae bacterium]